jgi:hypothetical protein
MTWSKPEKDFCIYALKCPETNIVKYVGLTTIGVTRFSLHWRDLRPNKNGKIIRVKAWIQKLKNLNKKFLVEYLDYADSKEELMQKEIYWIKYYRDLGIDLLNHADGGYIPPIKSYTDEEKLEISKRTKIAMAKPEVRANYLKGYKNRSWPKNYKPRSEETKKIHANSEYIKNKQIKVQDSNGVIYESLKIAAEVLGVTKQAIWRHLKGKQKTVKGLKLVKYVR